MDQKKELGKGIRALLGNMESSKTTTAPTPGNTLASVQWIPLKYIEPNPSQPRIHFDQESLKELADTIKTMGVIQPITVRKISDQKYQIISGERRSRASRLAGLTDIPAYIRSADDQGILEMALVENVQREDLNAIEVAVSLARLVQECKLTHEELSNRVGMNRSSVSNYLRLLKLPPDIQLAVKSNQLSMGHARALAGIENLLLQIKLFKETILREWSVRQLEQTIKSYATQTRAVEGTRIKSTNSDTGLKPYIDLSNSIFGRKTIVKLDKNGKGNITVPINDFTDLQELLERLS